MKTHLDPIFAAALEHAKAQLVEVNHEREAARAEEKSLLKKLEAVQVRLRRADEREDRLNRLIELL